MNSTRIALGCKKTNSFKEIATVGLCFLLSSCASYTYTDAPPTLGGLYSKYLVIGYDGDIKPIEEVGIVTTDGLIQVRNIDGQPEGAYRKLKSGGFYSGGRYQLHLLPGTHVLKVGFHDDRGGGTRSWSTSDVTTTVDVAVGSVVHLSKWEQGYKWGAAASDGSAALPVIAEDFDALRNKK